MRECLAHHHVDAVALRELAELGDGRARVARGVLDDHLDLAAGDLMPRFLQVHLEAVDHVPSDLGGPARERRQEADLDGLLLRLDGRQHGDADGQEGEDEDDDGEPAWCPHAHLSSEERATNCRFIALTCAR